MVKNKTKQQVGLCGLLVLVLMMVMLAAMPVVVLAANGDGTGSSTGVMKPLGLTSVTLADGTNVNGAVNIPLKTKITFLFDKNVVYLLYWERNKACFHLYDENNKELAINVTKIDDTVDFSKRQYIWVEPVEPLSPGTNYKIFVSPDLLAKNGGSTLAMTTDGKGSTIKFRTTGEKAIANSGTPESGKETTVVQAAVDSQDKSVPNSQDKPVANSPDQPAAGDTGNSSPVGSSSTTPSTPAADTHLTSSETTKPPETQNQEKQAEPTVAAGADAANRVQYKVADYVAGVAVVLIVVWLAYEFVKRKKGRNKN